MAVIKEKEEKRRFEGKEGHDKDFEQGPRRSNHDFS